MKKINNDIYILYEDNHIIVCNKPEGILSQEDITKKPDMLTIIKEYLKVTYQKPGNVFLGLCHRLDCRVSGVMVFAKTSKAAKRLSEDIRLKNFQKTYLAVVVGVMESNGFLDNKLSKNNYRAEEDEDGKECRLSYQVINHFELDKQIFSVLKVDLLTGRFNQIRKQLSIINHPIVNDFKYGYQGKNYDDHLGLYGYELSFNHPVTKVRFEFTLPQECIEGKWKEYLKLGEK